jgi:capsular exopolysaccharide synthesis family protein
MNELSAFPSAAPALTDALGSPASPDARGYQATAPQLAQIWAILRKRRWLILAIMTFALLAGIVITLLSTPQYTATSTVEIQRESRNFTNVNGAERDQTGAAIDQEFYQTQYGLLQAQSLADEVVKSLRLADTDALFAAFKFPAAKRWFNNGQPTAAAKAAAGLLLSHVTVKPEHNSSLVAISFTSPDPRLSQQVVNTWGTDFIQSSLDRRFQQTSYARTYLEQRIAQLRDRIDQTELGLVQYAAKQGLVSVPGASGGDGASESGSGASAPEVPLIASDLGSLNGELARATAARIVAESRLNSVGHDTTEELQNQALGTMRARRAELAGEYAKLLQQFDPQFPTARALRSQIASLDHDIAREEGRVGGSLQDNFRAAAAREKELQAKVGGLKSSVLDYRRRNIQYDILKRDVDTNRQLYAALLQRYKEIGVAGGVGVNNISIIDQANLPSVPSSPNLPLNIALALLAGIVTSVAVVLVLEQTDASISDPIEIETSLGIPLIGTVPKVIDDKPRASLEDPKTAVSEAYVSLQTVLDLSTARGFPRTLAVTSSRAGEGKSTTTYALARNLAALGRRVLLVDGDMRSPSIHHIFDIQAIPGLSNYLSGDDYLASIVQNSHLPNLYVMSAGLRPPNPTGLLSSERLGEFVAACRENYDHVLIDSPPVMGLADALLLGHGVDNVLFVIEAHGTNKGAARVAVARLRAAQVNILGAVLTKFDAAHARYGYDYDYAYGYSYGHDAEGSLKR